MKAANILETIGNTPVVRINRLFGDRAEVWIKQERANPGGSIKDRIAMAMVEDAERRGILKPGGTIIEPTSGNTGIGLAMVAAVKGYKLILVMPDSMSLERRRLMLAYGAQFDLTPKEKGMSGAVDRARKAGNKAGYDAGVEAGSQRAAFEASFKSQIWHGKGWDAGEAAADARWKKRLAACGAGNYAINHATGKVEFSVIGEEPQ